MNIELNLVSALVRERVGAFKNNIKNIFSLCSLCIFCFSVPSVVKLRGGDGL